MDDDLNVSQVGECWGQIKHRSLKINRCENGYIVEFERVSEKDDPHQRTVREKRVFITNSDMVEFVEKYFEGEPRP